MASFKRRTAAAGLALGLAGATLALSGAAAGANRDQPRWTTVPANADARGVTVPNVLSPGFIEFPAAQGSMRVENPTADVPFYGYNGNGSLIPDPAVPQVPGRNTEANKTEPAKNTYLRLQGLDGTLWIVEDVGGTTVPTAAKNPNSFVYRLVLNDKRDIRKGGRLQALQVTSRRNGQPIRFQAVDATHPTGGAFTDDMKDLGNYG